jgi:ABC-type sugar transport system ATPase subunit
MISIHNLRVDLGKFLLQDITLDIEDGEYFIILGPTGAGKTILLETIAGLYPVLQGDILINGQDITYLKPNKRHIGIVYQTQDLFPHLLVKDNIAFGLKSAKYPGDEITHRVNSIAEVLGITDLLKRRPSTLSGGERQKVALARALITDPVLLLLDEPLSALDQETRENMQHELAKIHHQLKTTIIHVTHHFEEATALGNRIAVMADGHILQIGTPKQIFHKPNSEFVARFTMSRNIFAGDVKQNPKGDNVFCTSGIEMRVATKLRGHMHAIIRPEDIFISRECPASNNLNAFPGKITHITDYGSVIYLTVTVPPDFVCLITRQTFEELNTQKEERVWISFKSSAIHLI